MHTSLFVLSHVLATTPQPAKKGGGFGTLLLIPIVFVVAYVAFIRPSRNRQRAALQERREAQVGDEITTTAGLIATVVAIDDDYLTLEVAPGVHSRYLPAAVLRVNTDEDDEFEDDDEGHDHDHEGHDHDHEGHDHSDHDHPDHDHDGVATSPDLATHEVIEAPATEATDSSGDSTTDTNDETTSA